MSGDEKGASIHDWLYNIFLLISLGIIGLIIIFMVFQFGLMIIFVLGT